MEIAKIYVVIVTYNGKQWYDRCFSSLRESIIPVQAIVVDNASTDDTVEYLELNFPEVMLIQSTVNLGFGQGNNIGIKYALGNGADYVFLLNQDAWVAPDTFAELIRIHKEHPEFGILSPMHLNAEKINIEKGLMHYIADFKTTSSKLIDDLYFQRLDDVYETNYVNAAAWLLPRKTLETVGGFDPIFYHYGEDDNYMHRVHYHGMRIGICPKVRIVHDTERRIIRKEFLDETNIKCLLVQVTNINNDDDIYSQILYLLKKCLLKALKLRLKNSKHYIDKLLFLIKMKSKIYISREQNKKQTNSWL